MGALAEFERDLIRKRTKAGLAAARARGNLSLDPQETREISVSLLYHDCLRLPHMS